MSGLTGKKNSTLIKASVKENKLLTVGVKSLRFWHEATAGETSIPFSSFVLLSAILSSGLSNPTSTNIISANLALFHTNVEVVSSLNGKLMEGLTYVVKNAQINFVNSYTATEGEIFEVTYKNDVVTGTNVVDARPLTATGVLTVGNTTFAVGETFKTNNYPSTQLGEVLVFVDGILQFRNVGNATANPLADGNYQEVHATGGYGSSIEFNDVFGTDVNVQVISRNLIAERPDISMMQLIESLGGQLDSLIDYVSADLGIDPSVFQVAPNQIDLKAFGDMVIANRENIKTKQDIVKVAVLKDVKTSGIQGGDFNSGVWTSRVLNTIEEDTISITLSNGTTGIDGTADRFIMGSGTYVIRAKAPGRNVDSHKLRIFNHTTGLAIGNVGGNAQSLNSATPTSTHAFLNKVIHLTETSEISIQHRCVTSQATNGFGIASNFDVEVYAEVEIMKLS